MEIETDSDESNHSLIDRRWKEIKTAMYGLATAHNKFELILTLLKLREDHTSAPTLSEITNFTGYDIAIKTIQGWDWEPSESQRSLEVDAAEIGKYGSELMVLHTIRESIRYGLLTWENNDLVETPEGEIHFDALNSFNVDITGSRMDIARKRFTQSRLTKKQRKMDPVNKIPIVKHLYWENSILMLLRAPLPFYHAMSSLTDYEQDYLLDLHSKMVKKASQDSSGLVRVRLTQSSKAAAILNKLTPPEDRSDRRPRFVACIKDKEYDEDGKVEFHIGLGGLTMFTMFLLGFDKDHLDDKAHRAEKAVREVIEHSGHWKVIESNTEVRQEEGEVITEIDIIAQSTKDEEEWLTCEVKDFSFWKGWIYGHGADNRKEYYTKAVEKLPIKEEFIQEKHEIDEITSIIVTSIPEPHPEIKGVPLVYLSDLSEHLAKISNVNYTPRKRHQSSNFLIRYFKRLQNDYENADKLNIPIEDIKTQIKLLRKELSEIKQEYEKNRNTYKMIVSDYDTLTVSEKLASKRLLMDEGDRHYQLQEELDRIRARISKKKRERKVKAKILRDLKKKYNEKLKQIKEKDAELNKLILSRERQLAPRLF